jgi:magnesium chelatase subunit D
VNAAADAALAASVFAVDPAGLGGVCLRSQVQPARTQWLEMLRELLPADAALRRMPFNITDGRLLGGLDLVATLRANRPVAERGVLAATDGGVVVITMAERLTPHTAACVNSVLDSGEVTLQREGVEIHDRARIGIVALDESTDDQERLAASVLDRLALLVDLSGFDLRTPLLRCHDRDEIVAARRLLPQVTLPAEGLTALCATAMALGAGSTRVSLLAARAAMALAVLDGRRIADTEDVTQAARLVLAPRATQLPQSDEPNPEQSAESPPPPEQGAPDAEDRDAAGAAEPNARADASDLTQREIEDIVLEAARAAIPAGLLATLRAAAGTEARSTGRAGGRAGALRSGGARGRPAGVRAGMPQGHARLNLMETLRAAAPWQRLRGRLGSADVRVRVDASDFRVTRYQQRSQTLIIFAVDASGSSALNRLAEAKGAVELLLADCYVRRDQVAVIAFRGRGADLLLPPTRSLVRAKRSLAGLPGGGGTPLASGMQHAMLLATQALRRGETPTLVLLTDGRANVARDGTGGRERAHGDALLVARQLRLLGLSALFIDTSPRPNPQARELSNAMAARYLTLPFAGSQALASVVTAATTRAR